MGNFESRNKQDACAGKLQVASIPRVDELHSVPVPAPKISDLSYPPATEISIMETAKLSVTPAPVSVKKLEDPALKMAGELVVTVAANDGWASFRLGERKATVALEDNGRVQFSHDNQRSSTLGPYKNVEEFVKEMTPKFEAIFGPKPYHLQAQLREIYGALQAETPSSRHDEAALALARPKKP